MLQCYKSGDFNKYFTENMTALGLVAPSSLFDSSEKAVATATTMLSAITQLGKGATVTELVGATTGLEQLLVVGAMSAAGYAGAVIGSIAVATGRTLSCGSRISDFFVFIDKNNLKFKGWDLFYASNPQILNTKLPSRNSYGIRCRYNLSQFDYA